MHGSERVYLSQGFNPLFKLFRARSVIFQLNPISYTINVTPWHLLAVVDVVEDRFQVAKLLSKQVGFTQRVEGLEERR